MFYVFCFVVSESVLALLHRYSDSKDALYVVWCVCLANSVCLGFVSRKCFCTILRLCRGTVFLTRLFGRTSTLFLWKDPLSANMF